MTAKVKAEKADRTLAVELVVVMIAFLAIALSAVSLVRGHDWRAAHDALHTERQRIEERDRAAVRQAQRAGAVAGEEEATRDTQLSDAALDARLEHDHPDLSARLDAIERRFEFDDAGDAGG